MILTIFESYVILDLLDESPRSLVVPRAAPGPLGATSNPTTHPDHSRGRPGLLSSSSRHIHDIVHPKSTSKIHGRPGKIKDFSDFSKDVSRSCSGGRGDRRVVGVGRGVAYAPQGTGDSPGGPPGIAGTRPLGPQ